MNGTQKDIEHTKRLFEDKDDTVERLRGELGRFIVHQCSGGWTKEQVELLTLRRLLLEAADLADSEYDTREIHQKAKEQS